MKKAFAVVLFAILVVTFLLATTKENQKNNENLSGAIFMGDIDEIRRLIEAGVDVKSKFDAFPGKGLTPFLFACMAGIGESTDRADIVKALLDAGAKIDKKFRGTPLLHAVAQALAKNSAVIELLIANGFDVNESFEGGTPLHAAAHMNRVEAAKTLIENGAEIDAKHSNFGEYTALHIAVLGHHKEVTELFLVKGADVEAKSRGKNGETPLDIAIRQGSPELYELLRKHGAIDYRIGDSSSLGAISNVERDALMAIYNSTNGDNWTYKTNWKGPQGTEHIWYMVVCDSGKNHIERIGLVHNNMVGQIPSELGNLTELIWLNLKDNQLSGSLPPELGHFMKLENLEIGGNQLTGHIPSELGGLINLENLDISSNQLTGHIPSELGGLINLKSLSLNRNQLSGSIPHELRNLKKLKKNSILLSYNALYTEDASLRDFLNSKQYGGDWEVTQTVAPANVTADALTGDSIKVSWTPIRFTDFSGGYRVLYGTSSGGPYTVFGITADKKASFLNVSGLNPGTTYYFVVQTVTYPHIYNENTVISEYSKEAIGK